MLIMPRERNERSKNLARYLIAFESLAQRPCLTGLAKQTERFFLQKQNLDGFMLEGNSGQVTLGAKQSLLRGTGSLLHFKTLLPNWS